MGTGEHVGVADRFKKQFNVKVSFTWQIKRCDTRVTPFFVLSFPHCLLVQAGKPMLLLTPWITKI